MANYVTIKVSPEAKKDLMETCKKCFLEDNPEFKEIKHHLSADFLLKRVTKYYMYRGNIQ